MPFRPAVSAFALALALLSSSAVPSAQTNQSVQAQAGVTVKGRAQVDDQHPVRRAHVVVTGSISIETDTDTDGRFVVDKLSHGSCRFVITKPGFVQAEPFVLNVAGTYYLWAGHSYYPQVSERADADPLKVVAGETVDVRMLLDYESPPAPGTTTPKGSAITGRIVDEFGDPAPDVTVAISRRVFTTSPLRFIPFTDTSRTDDLGQFRLSSLPPGEYFLTALSGSGLL